MDKKIGVIIGILALGFMFWFVVSFFNTGNLTGFAVFSQGTQNEFDLGSYNNTAWNGSSILLSSGALSGSYTSKIFDAGGNATWNFLNFSKSNEGELNDATFLVHFNNNFNDINGNIASSESFPVFEAGKFGQAGSFNGQDNYLEFNPGVIQGKFSISAWAQITNTDISRVIVGTRNPEDSGFDFKFDNCENGPCIHGDIGNGNDWITTNADSDFAYEFGKWYNIVYVVDETGYFIYVDGNKLASGEFNDAPLLTDENHHLYIGQVGYGDEFFQGLIDEVAVWNHTLTDNEVLENYKLGILRLNMSIKVCDSCENESWLPASSLPLTGRYFQYKSELASDNAGYSPWFGNVNIDYNITEALVNNTNETNEPVAEIPVSSSSGSYGGGGCYEYIWKIGEWSACENGQETVVNTSNCGNAKTETKTCLMPVVNPVPESIITNEAITETPKTENLFAGSTILDRFRNNPLYIAIVLILLVTMVYLIFRFVRKSKKKR